MSAGEGALSAAFALISTQGFHAIRNAEIPTTIPSAGLVILRDGDPGEPDITLNPISEYYSHVAEVEVFAGEESTVFGIWDALTAALALDPSLGGAVSFSFLGDNIEIQTLDIEGAAPILVGTFPFILEYESADLLA